MRTTLTQKQSRQILSSWSPCTLCPLHERTQQQVIYKGSFPSKLFIIGEAPGRSEEATGKPFVGRSGKLLDHILQEAFELDDSPYTLDDCLVTNVVACVPWADADNREGFRPPTKTECEACEPRLEALYRLAKPEGIILVGRSAYKAFSNSFFSRETWLPPVANIYHPSYLLRQGNSPSAKRRSVDYSKTLLELRTFLRTLR